MVARSFTACGLVPLAETRWNDLLHSRLKPVLCPDEPVVLDDDDESDDDMLNLEDIQDCIPTLIQEVVSCVVFMPFEVHL